MRPLVAYRADGELTLRTRANFPPTLNVHVFWLNPFATPFLGAIDPVLACPLFELPVPVFLEFVVEQRFDMLQGDVLLGAATGRHVRGVFYAHLEYALEACMTHSVSARQLGGSRCRDGVVAAGQTGDELLGWRWRFSEEGGKDGRGSLGFCGSRYAGRAS